MISHAYALLTGSLRVTTCQTVELTEARKLWYKFQPVDYGSWSRSSRLQAERSRSPRWHGVK